jgi:hypothetical protein
MGIRRWRTIARRCTAILKTFITPVFYDSLISAAEADVKDNFIFTYGKKILDGKKEQRGNVRKQDRAITVPL